MQIRARDQLDRRRDQGENLRGRILSQIDGSRREIDLGEVTEAAHVTVALLEVEEANVARVEHFAQRLARRRIAHEEDRVRISLDQRVLRRLALQVEQLRSSTGLDSVRLE